MELFFKKEECCGCGACVDICQIHAVHMSRDEEGFPYPKIDSSLCVRCGRCEAVCPVKNCSLSEEVGCRNKYIGAQAKNDIVRETSSSGGVFSILSQYILDRKGVVFGAGYNSRMEVIHQEAANQEQLDTIKRTKYVQSNMQGIFLKVEQRLKEGRWVLFCGTPCQAHALRLFLGREYDTLAIADLVCYGVPSPGIWEDYVKYLEGKHHGKMTEFSFRDKRARDHGHTCAYVINGAEYAGSLFQDKFCRMYFKNYILRPSCHSCRFCTAYRSSDFTLGDFWGIEKVRPDLDDGMGNSMVILHTERAKKIWEQVQENLEWFECGKEELLQPRLIEPTGMAKGRGLFMTLYKLLPFFLFIRGADDRPHGFLKK